MNMFVHKSLGHYLMDEVEEGLDLGGGSEQEDQEQEDGEDGQDGEGDGGEEGEGQDDGGLVVTIGDEAEAEDEAEKSAPAWVKELRKSHRETQRENRELKAKLQQAAAPQQKAPEVGKKPTLEDCDYDGDKFEQELLAWQGRKMQADQAAKQQEDEQKAQQQAWESRLNVYTAAKAELKVKDFEDAEEVATGLFSEVQRALIIDAADNPALVIYALGKNPTKAKELAAITHHTKFLREISRLEDTKLKVQNGKKPPAPERQVSGTGKLSGVTGGSDATLERLRAEAEKTGDMSKVVAYKRELRNKQKK